MITLKEPTNPDIRRDDFDWDNVNWEDPDAGEYTNICPDSNRKLFEYGARCIAEIAQKRDVRKMLIRLPPSKISRELKQLRNDLRKLSFTTYAMLFDKDDKPFNTPLDQLKRRVELALERVPKGRPKRHETRVELGRNAWAIWTAHDGDVEDDDFLAFVERLINNSGHDEETSEPENSIDTKKSWISADTLTREIRVNAKTSNPPAWQLF